MAKICTSKGIVVPILHNRYMIEQRKQSLLNNARVKNRLTQPFTENGSDLLDVLLLVFFIV